MSQQKVTIPIEDVHFCLDPHYRKNEDGTRELVFISPLLLPFQLKSAGGHGELRKNLNTKNYEYFPI